MKRLIAGKYLCWIVGCYLGCVLATPALALYDAYPSNGGPYVTGPVSETLSWTGDNFESYSDGQVIEASTSKNMQSHLDVTSGTLWSKYVHGSTATYRRGYTDDYNFRMVALGYDDQNRRIKWTDQTAEYRGYVKNWQSGLPDWAGFHVFARYQTSDDLYVASLRYDGHVTIKQKWNGVYTDLAIGNLDSSYLDGNGHLQTGRWYQLRFAVIGDQLTFFVDGNELLNVTNNTIDWGTTGVRIDYADAYLDDWHLTYIPAPEPTSAALMGVCSVLIGFRCCLRPAQETGKADK